MRAVTVATAAVHLAYLLLMGLLALPYPLAIVLGTGAMLAALVAPGREGFVTLRAAWR